MVSLLFTFCFSLCVSLVFAPFFLCLCCLVRFFFSLRFHQAMKSLQYSHFVRCLYLIRLSFRYCGGGLNYFIKSWERHLMKAIIGHGSIIHSSYMYTFIYINIYCVHPVYMMRGDIGHGFVTITNNFSLNHTFFSFILF